VLLIFVFLVYTSNSSLGSPKKVYEHLMVVGSASRVCSGALSLPGQSCGPVEGNFKGSYLTMLSSGGLVFGIINIVGNFGTVFVDNVRASLDLFRNFPSIMHALRSGGVLVSWLIDRVALELD
jgi:Na+/proline symporter